MRDKLATGLSIMALAFVMLLHLQVNHLQVEQHTYESKDDEEVPVTQVNGSPTRN